MLQVIKKPAKSIDEIIFILKSVNDVKMICEFRSDNMCLIS
jgi:hypothetical protein